MKLRVATLLVLAVVAAAAASGLALAGRGHSSRGHSGQSAHYSGGIAHHSGIAHFGHFPGAAHAHGHSHLGVFWSAPLFVPWYDPLYPSGFYYCPYARAYYPYVRDCPGGWQVVPGSAPPP